MSADPTPRQAPRRSYRGPRITGVALLGLGLLVLYQTFQIRQGGGYSAIGPRFFPLIVAIGLIALSLIFVLRVTALPDEDLGEQVAAEEAATYWPTVGWTALALVVYALSLGTLGYIVASALFFPVVAWLLGSRRPARDTIIGLLIGVVIFFSFTRVLGVRLPAGVLDFLL